MNIDKNKKVFVIDFDNHLYDLLKDEYEIVKHSNYMSDFLEYNTDYDILLVDIIYKDGDIFELVKKLKVKPYCLEDISSSMSKRLANKVHFITKDDLFIKDNYIDIKMDLDGYRLTMHLLRLLIENNEMIKDMESMYSLVGNPSSVEKNVRYFKEKLFLEGILESNTTKFNKQYPTNTEFLRLLLELHEDKKIKV